MFFVDNIKKLTNYSSTFWDIKRFILNEVISLEECRRLINEWLTNRQDNFLSVMKDLIYTYKKSPYLKLLELSRISYEDIKKMVSRENIEGALRILKEEGVYITGEEFKGRRCLRRKGGVFKFSPENFLNPLSKGLGEVYGGASTGAALRMRWTAGYIMQKAVHYAVMFEAHNCFDTPLIIWQPNLPAQVGLLPFIFQKIGVTSKMLCSPVKFTPLEPLIYKSLFMSVAGGRRNEIFLKYVSLKDAYLISRWIARHMNDFSACTVRTFVSGALRICIAAKEQNLDISKAKFIVSSEPLTAIRRKEIEACGCEVINTYHATEAGFIGCSCNKDNSADDVHFFKDSFAILRYPHYINNIGLDVESFLFTALYPGCPFVMLNMELGDYGIIEKKKCGCLLEKYGFDEHIHNIRSHEKITVESVKCSINDILQVIEKTFPDEFGGSSVDYQLVEEEMESGLRKLIIQVSPRMNALDEERMKRILFEQISSNADADLRIKIWRQVDALSVRREEPIATKMGKTPAFIKRDIIFKKYAEK